ncbi:CD48 antigen [Apus apus]|uniref:CD48 antigen n=1 Tax=Apus apus TaxID=8895 RepID=UPI0021F8DF86|nr:CD48 antigen [Apus apus]
MSAALTWRFFFLLFIMPAWARHHPSSEVVGAVGGVAYLSPTVPHQTYHRTQWRRNNSVQIANWDGGEKVHYLARSYQGRLELFPNHTLKISPLQKSDSSIYQVYLEDEEGEEHIEDIHLKVYELVPQPTVKANVTRNDPSRCQATLVCSVGLEEVTYEWIPPRKLSLEGTNAPQLGVSFKPSEETYICKVSNPVSSNSSSLTYRPPCSWTGESSAAASFTTNVLVALGYPLVLLLLFTLA